jgi:predicted nucleic-acid-binding protein
VLAIDTNVVVRYLTGDHPEQASRARGTIDGGPVFVPVTVILETEWVLRSAYGFRSADVVHALRSFGGLPTVSIEDADAVAVALDLAALGVDFADALHLGRSGHCDGFLTFDRRLARAATDAGITMVRAAD